MIAELTPAAVEDFRGNTGALEQHLRSRRSSERDYIPMDLMA